MPLPWLRRSTERVIDDALWQRLLLDYPFVGHVGPSRLPSLHRLTNAFLADKRFSGEAGLELDDYIGASIAIQACVPVIELGLAWYDDFTQIVVYPDEFRVPRREVDEAGVVHEDDAWLAGEAHDGGPVIVSWADAGPSRPDAFSNVVIHEFIHKIDLRDGMADGVPPLPRGQTGAWERAITQAHGRFIEQIDQLEASLPSWLDPESPQADDWYARLPLDPYAATDPAEFFAVLGETFFLDSAHVRRHWPTLFELLSGFFGFTPLGALNE